jgi:hypothetical protein
VPEEITMADAEIGPAEAEIGRAKAGKVPEGVVFLS